MADHVTTVCRAGYYQQLRQLLQITQSRRQSLRFYFYNGISDSELKRLQSVQNAAARMITRTKRTEHITSVLQSLRWLPVRQRIFFYSLWRLWSTRASTGVHHQPERRSATAPLPSTDHASGTFYRRQFSTQHYQLLSLLIDSRLIRSFNSCDVRYSERTPVDVLT